MATLDEFAQRKTLELGAQSLLRTLRDAPETALNFCSNDYLGLSSDGRLKAAAVAATEASGVGAGASRLVTGNHALYRQLEARIAEIKGTERALVFGAGYLANIGAIPALVSERDVVIVDELSHACMMSGARLSGAAVHRFRHNDVAHLRALLMRHRAEGENCLVLTEGVFSMDGDLAPLAAIAPLVRSFDAWLMTDDAHGLGVLGGGRGSAAQWKVRPDVQMGTLSKAVGSLGGYVAASEAVVSLLINRARSLVYATGLPPGVVAASIAGLNVIAGEPELCARPLANALLFAEQLGLPVPQSAIVPLIVGRSDAAMEASARLEGEGFVVTAIRPPTVPEGTGRLRFTFTASHKRDDILRLAGAVRRLVLPLTGRTG